MLALRTNYPVGLKLGNSELDSIFKETDLLFKTFDGLAHEVQSISKGNYPPHNILEDRIEVAVAGFKKEELNVRTDDGKLFISGSQKDRESRTFIQKGISEKDFELKFKLDKYYLVSGSTLVDGILTVFLNKVVPDELKPKQIAIE